MQPVVVGLVGGIGAGKSTVAQALAEAGCVVVDSDHLNRQALADPKVIRQVVDVLGPDVLDAAGVVDRRRLAARVFGPGGHEARAQLEAITHPWIDRARAALLAQAERDGARAVVLDSPLLLEAGLATRCDALIFVDCPREVRLLRVRQRGWDDAELARRESAQWPLDRKRAACQYRVESSGEAAQASAAARKALDAILADVAGRAASLG